MPKLLLTELNELDKTFVSEKQEICKILNKSNIKTQLKIADFKSKMQKAKTGLVFNNPGSIEKAKMMMR